LKERKKEKQAEKPIKKSISSFLDLLKNYYHYFVQPEPEKSIMLVYNYILIHTKNRIIKAKQKHTTTYPRKLCLQ